MKFMLRLFVATCALTPLFAFAQSEEKSFKNTLSKDSRSDACQNAKDSAQQWLKENTDRSHSYYGVNQLKRGWVAKSDGTPACECDKQLSGYVCVVDAKISAISGSNVGGSSGSLGTASVIGAGNSKISACDDAKEKATNQARQAGKTARTGACDCEPLRNSVNGAWQCRVDVEVR